ncbi:unnamed protein product [Camellia sinensis]
MCGVFWVPTPILIVIKLHSNKGSGRSKCLQVEWKANGTTCCYIGSGTIRNKEECDPICKIIASYRINDKREIGVEVREFSRSVVPKEKRIFVCGLTSCVALARVHLIWGELDAFR